MHKLIQPKSIYQVNVALHRYQLFLVICRLTRLLLMPWPRRLPSHLCQTQQRRSDSLSPAQRRRVLPTSTRNTKMASHPGLGSHWRPWWGQYPQRSALGILSITSTSAPLHSLKLPDLHCLCHLAALYVCCKQSPACCELPSQISCRVLYTTCVCICRLTLLAGARHQLHRHRRRPRPPIQTTTAFVVYCCT